MAKIQDVKRFEKEVPYTVKDAHKGAAEAYNAFIETKSVDRRIQARNRAVDAWAHVSANHEAYKAGNWTPPPKTTVNTVKPSMISRLYNWFLTINF